MLARNAEIQPKKPNSGRQFNNFTKKLHHSEQKSKLTQKYQILTEEFPVIAKISELLKKHTQFWPNKTHLFPKISQL